MSKTCSFLRETDSWDDKEKELLDALRKAQLAQGDMHELKPIPYVHFQNDKIDKLATKMVMQINSERPMAACPMVECPMEQVQ